MAIEVAELWVFIIVITFVVVVNLRRIYDKENTISDLALHGQ